MGPREWTAGELDFSSGNIFARLHFMGRVPELVPEVLDDLEEIAQEYSEAPPVEREYELQRWAERWHLWERWTLRRARVTVDAWLHFDDLDRSSFVSVLPETEEPPSIDGFEYSGRTWHPWGFNRRKFKEMVHRDVEEALEEYMDRVERRLVNEGPYRNSARKRKQKEHFDWLIFYQVEGLSYSRVADRVTRSRQTVTEAIKDTAHLVNLTLRPPDRGGRPPKDD